MRRRSAFQLSPYPENSCPSVRGNRVHQGVRPNLGDAGERLSLSSRASRKAPMAGSSRWVISFHRSDVMAVGKNVGSTTETMVHVVVGVDRHAWIPLRRRPSRWPGWRITSLAVHVLWVPLPVCQHAQGENDRSSMPSDTSRAAAMISADFSGDSLPRSALTRRMPLEYPIARMSRLLGHSVVTDGKVGAASGQS